MKSIDGISTTPPTALDMWNRWRLRFHRDLVEPTQIRVDHYSEKDCTVCRSTFLSKNNRYHCSTECEERGSFQAELARGA